MIKKRILFIINPISGTLVKQLKKKKLIKKIDKLFALDKYEYDISIVYTEFQGHATILAADAAANGYSAVIAIGGDGSINEISRGIVNTETALGIIPLGSGNGLAHYLKIPFNLTRALKVIKAYKTENIDTVSLNDTLFVSIAGIGFDAKVAELYASAKMRGLFSYFFIALTQYMKYIPEDYKLYVDGKEINADALLIGFGNSGQFGYNFSITPDSKLDDGLIDVCIIKKVPPVVAPLLGLLFWFRLAKFSSYVKFFKGSQIKIIKKNKSSVNVDGEAIKFKDTINIKVNPKSLKIIIP